jgi:tetratricopeptide (TPR) repeat protein
MDSPGIVPGGGTITAAAPPKLRDRRGRAYEPAIGPRLKVLLFAIFAAVAFLGATGAYLTTIRVLEWRNAPRVYQNQFSLWMFAAHLVIGVLFVLPFVFFGLIHLKSSRHRKNRVAIRLGIMLFLTGLAVCVSGLALIQLDVLPQLPTSSLSRWIVYGLHIAAPILAVGLYVLHRRAGPRIKWKWGYAWAGTVAMFVAGMVAMHSQDPRKWYAKGSPEGERYFEPSKARTLDGNFIPETVLMKDEYCLQCHADIYNSHIHSVHKFSSFNNPAYLFSVRETRKTAGIRASRWCAGCHDPVPFFSGKFDDPNFDDVNDPTAKAGITCTVCHAITNVNSRIGNADYTIEYPLHYPFAYSDNPVLQWFNRQLVKAKPEFHKRTFLKDFHRTERFCSTCHKVGVPMEVNHYKEFLRGQNHNDPFILSGAHGGARSWYYPPAAKASCADCHMPLAESKDFGSRDFDGSGVRKTHLHNFPGANTAIPDLLHFPDQVDLQTKFLQDKQLRIDIFGLKEGGTTDGRLLAPIRAEKRVYPEYVAALGAAPTAGLASLPWAALIRSEEKTLPRLEPGKTYLVEVVIRTLGLGHPFTQGTADSNEVWVDFEARTGDRVIGRSGALDKGDEGHVDPWSHFINILMLSRKSERIDRRNPQDIFTPLYNHQIPPGAGQVVHYKLHIPRDVQGPVELKVRLRFRKFDYAYMEYVFGKGKVPKLPIVDLCADRVLLPVAGVAERVPEQFSPIQPFWQRWNDYGIGCFLEGGPEGKEGGELSQAEDAFGRLLILGVPEARTNGYINLARVHLAYGGQERIDAAREALNQALKQQAKPNWWTIAWLSARVHSQQSPPRLDLAVRDYRKILDPENRDPKRKFDFTKDYVIIDELADVLYRRSQQEDDPAERQKYLRQAVTQYERTLAIDPEDVDAHYALMQAYSRLGEATPEMDPVPLPTDRTAQETRLEKLAWTFANVPDRSARLAAAAELGEALDHLEGQPSQPRLPVLALVVMMCRSVHAAHLGKGADAGLRAAASWVWAHADQRIFAQLPEVARVLGDEALPREVRRAAAAQLLQALQRDNKPPPPETVPLTLTALDVLPRPGLPANLAVTGLFPYRSPPPARPRLPALLAVRQQCRPLYEQEADPELRAVGARVLGAVHLWMHDIYRPDEFAQAVRQKYRDTHPAANNAAEAIVIYPTDRF